MEPMKILIKSDRKTILKETPTERILEIAVKAPVRETRRESPPMNLGLVIDRSGSMGGEKLEQVKSAVLRILELLDENDLISIVMFDNEVRTLCSGLRATAMNKSELAGSLRQLQAGGSTDLCSGYLEGCRCVANQPMEGRINRVLLLTDGQANVGVTDPVQISTYSSDLFERGISTSTFGVGLGFNEVLLQWMADRGGGHTYFIQEEREIQAFLLKEFAEMAAISAHKAEITLTFPADCLLEVYGDWKHSFHSGILQIALSDLAADSVTSVMIKALTPPGDGELTFLAMVEAVSREGDTLRATDQLVMHYGSRQEMENESPDRELLGMFASVLFGHVAREAIHLERNRKFAEAEDLLKTALDAYGDFAPESIQIQFKELKEQIRFGLDEGTRKQSSQVFHDMIKTRHQDQRSNPDPWKR